MSELKPCPFCGSEDYYIAVTDNPFSYDTYSTTHCSKCHATGPFVAESYLEDEPKPTRDYMEAVAKEKWQTRPIEVDLRKRIAELTECVGSKMVDVYTLKARIAELEALVDELVNIGDNLFDSLNPIAWKHEWLDKWWKLSSCRRGEREE